MGQPRYDPIAGHDADHNFFSGLSGGSGSKPAF
jgi:hypothetical protein